MANSQAAAKPFTFDYKRVNEASIRIDIYPPAQIHSSGKVPALVYFHGGGLTVGNRNSWFPTWLRDRVLASGFAFCSAEHRLIPPSTGHDIVEDMKDLFRFLENDVNSLLAAKTHENVGFGIDFERIAVAGSSAGGLCAYLAAMHATPKPVAIVALYAMGGNFLTPQQLVPKTEVFFRGRELLDPKDYTEFLWPASQQLAVTADSALAYHDKSYKIPGFPANPRMLLTRLYFQQGIFLDYYTGDHQPSLSDKLRPALDTVSSTNELKHLIPERHISLFPQFNISPNWPPTILVHGELDSAVQVNESKNLYRLLKTAGVDATLRIMDGLEHSFDYVPDALEKFGQKGGIFDEIETFIHYRMKDVVTHVR
ncbi:AB hydrolase superfamily protein [Abortiporus biennis]